MARLPSSRRWCMIERRPRLCCRSGATRPARASGRELCGCSSGPVIPDALSRAARHDPARPAAAGSGVRLGTAAGRTARLRPQGVTHTLCSPEAVALLQSLVTAPFEPYDALVCTSRAVADMVREVTGDVHRLPSRPIRREVDRGFSQPRRCPSGDDPAGRGYRSVPPRRCRRRAAARRASRRRR